MAKLLPLARKKCLLETPLGIPKGLLGVRSLLSSIVFTNKRGYSSRNSDTNESRVIDVKYQQQSGELQTTFSKVKENTKTVSYMGVIIAGLGVTAVIFYTVLKELFSAKSPNNIYSQALERCRNDPHVQNALGVPIKGFGEESRRGRRRHVSHIVFKKDGIEHLRMKFYIEGLRKKATVFLEMKDNEDCEYIYRYLFVETDDFGRPPIVLEDNRYGHVDPPKGKHIGEDKEFAAELETEVL